MDDVAASRARTGFVGRSDQLSRFDELLALGAGGGAAAALVSGDAGVGKTSLLGEAAARARAAGALVLLGRCVDIGAGGLAYLPFAEALTQLVRAAGDGAGDQEVAGGQVVRQVAEQLPVLRRLAGAPLQAPPQQEQAVERLPLFDAVSAVLGELSRRVAPVVLLLEDLHWADASTRDLLRFLLARLGTAQRQLVIGTLRSDDLHRRHPLRPLLAELIRLPGVELMDLPAFDDDELRDYLGGLHGASLPEPVLRDIAERSEGNAFFAAELLAAGAGRVGRLPAALADVLLTRLERLTAEAQLVARAAAVGGQRVGDRLLRGVLELPDAGLDEAIRETLTHHVLEPDGAERYAFRHALLQEAVYHELLPGERVRLHAAFARQLAAGESPAVAAELARHCLASHDLPGALGASVRAGDEAVRRLAPAEALAHYEQALQLWPGVEPTRRPGGLEAVELGLRAAMAASGSGELARALALAEQALQAAIETGDAVREATARGAMAMHLYGVDRFDEAELQARAARAALAGLPVSPAAVWAAAIEVRVAGLRGDVDAVRRIADTAIAEARRLGLAAAEADLVTSLAVAQAAVGEPEDAVRRLAEVRRSAGQSDDPAAVLRSGYNLAMGLLDLGDIEQALAVLDDALTVAQRAGMGASLYAIEARWAQISSMYIAGDWDGVTTTLARVAEVVPPAVVRRIEPAALPVLAARDPAAAVRGSDQRPADESDLVEASHFGYGARAEALTWLNRPLDAVTVVDEALALLDRAGEPLHLGGIWLCALALAALADAAEAAAHTAEAGEVARLRADGARFLDGARLRAANGKPRLAVLGPEGRAWLARAEAEAGRLHGRSDPQVWEGVVAAFGFGHRYELARSRLGWAEALLAAGRRTEAGREAAAAREVAVALKARPLRDAVDVLARRGRLDLGAGPVAGPEAVLTPRERDVMRLVAQGLTNRQVGQRLFISEKTASVHVSNVLAKLGASRRTEAVSIAHRRGLLDDVPPPGS